LPRWGTNQRGDAFLAELRGELNLTEPSNLEIQSRALQFVKSFLQLGVRRRVVVEVVDVIKMITMKTESL